MDSSLELSDQPLDNSPTSVTHGSHIESELNETQSTENANQEPIGLPDPLTQLLTALCRSASDQAPDDPVYLAYAKIMSKVNKLLNFHLSIGQTNSVLICSVFLIENFPLTDNL